MRRILCSFLIVTLHVMSWVFAACNAAHGEGTGSIFHPQAALEPKQGLKSMERMDRHGEAYKGLSTLGSRPPNCEHKCGGCRPCIAIQVPENTEHLGVQYANYMPEGWKCKCGSSFFNP